MGSYKDFQTGGNYPIDGVNFHADYGYLPGYIGEDGVDLDFFVGSDMKGKHGFFLVWRSAGVPQEHKYFICMSDEQLDNTLQEYEAVLVEKEARIFKSLNELQNSITEFQKK